MFSDNSVLPLKEESLSFFKGIIERTAPQVERMQMASAPSENSDIDTAIDTTDEAAVIGVDSPVVVAFADGVSPDKREAVLNCLQISERHANAAADQKTQPYEWHKAYKETMGHCGWVLTGYALQDHDTSNLNVTMDSLVLDIVAAAAGANAAAMLPLLSNVFDQIKKDNSVITLFDKNSSSGSAASCQIMPCLESKTGIAVTAFTALECNFSKTEGGSWFWKWKAYNMNVKKAAAVVDFNYRHYQEMESIIVESLGQSSRDFFSKINKSI